MPDDQSWDELVKKVRDADIARATALNELAAFAYERLGGCNHLHRLPTGVRFSDALQEAVKSFVSHIAHDRADEDSAWSMLAHAFLRKKIQAACRVAGRHSRVTQVVDPQVLEETHTAELHEEDATDRLFQAVENALPQEDGTARVFRELVRNGRTQTETAEVVNLSERTVGKKMEAAVNHLVDQLLATGDLGAETEEALRLVLDPRSRVRAVPQIKGEKRQTEPERRVIAAAKQIGVSQAEMTRRVERAFSHLAELLREFES
jgi:DNA-directed RNA polymerase specialized sigma24 family protein